MWAYLKIAIGGLLLVAAVVSTGSLLNGTVEKAAQSIVDNGVDTIGVVEKREQHLVAGRYGRVVGGGVFYTLTYRFTTLENETYGGKINVSKDDAYAVADGEEITVRYNKKQPTINAPLRFKDYMSQEDVENVPVSVFVFGILFYGLLGAWLVWSGWKVIRPSQPSRRRRPSSARVAGVSGAVSQPRAGFGQRG